MVDAVRGCSLACGVWRFVAFCFAVVGTQRGQSGALRYMVQAVADSRGKFGYIACVKAVVLFLLCSEAVSGVFFCFLVLAVVFFFVKAFFFLQWQTV